MIRDARRVYSEPPQLIAPGHRGALIVERTDGLPSVKPGIANGHRRIFGHTTQEAKATHPHQGNRAPLPRPLLPHSIGRDPQTTNSPPTARPPSLRVASR